MLYRGETTYDDGHRHQLVANSDGDGVTDDGPADGHTHWIRRFDVQPGGADGHVHQLQQDGRGVVLRLLS